MLMLNCTVDLISLGGQLRVIAAHLPNQHLPASFSYLTPSLALPEAHTLCLQIVLLLAFFFGGGGARYPLVYFMCFALE